MGIAQLLSASASTAQPGCSLRCTGRFGLFESSADTQLSEESLRVRTNNFIFGFFERVRGINRVSGPCAAVVEYTGESARFSSMDMFASVRCPSLRVQVLSSISDALVIPTCFRTVCCTHNLSIAPESSAGSRLSAQAVEALEDACACWRCAGLAPVVEPFHEAAGEGREGVPRGHEVIHKVDRVGCPGDAVPGDSDSLGDAVGEALDGGRPLP